MNGFPGTAVSAARQAEDEGWDGIGVPDSQNLTGDPYVALALAAHATSTLRLHTYVTNPLTRHPAVTATSIATVQAESNGRAVLGIGRGDSALAHLGLAPVPVRVFESYLQRLQGYLRGEAVPFEAQNDGKGLIESSEALGLGNGPESSRIRWLRHAVQPKVPVDVAASGPKVIASAARFAESVTFAVGASVDRIGWAVAEARRAREEAGPGLEPLLLGTGIPIAVALDRDEARSVLRPGFATYARFSVMHGSVAGPVPNSQRESLEAIQRTYDMNKHTTVGRHTAEVTDELIDEFGVAGPPSYCVERLAELIELGISSFIVSSGVARDGDPEAMKASRQSFVRDVLPNLK